MLLLAHVLLYVLAEDTYLGLVLLLELPDAVLDGRMLDARFGDEMRILGTQHVAGSRIQQLFLDLRVHGEHLADAPGHGLLLVTLGGFEFLERFRDGAMILLQQLQRVRCRGVATAATLEAAGLRTAAGGSGAARVACGAAARAQRAGVRAAAARAFAAAGAARAVGGAGAALRLA